MGDAVKRFLLLLLIIMTAPALTVASPIGVGVSGGALVPVGQADQDVGSDVGIKLRLRLSHLFAVEPNLNFGKFGAITIDGVGSRDGSTINHAGLDVTFGAPIASVGIKPYLLLGGGVYTAKRSGDETSNRSGWSFGGGLALGILSYIDIDLRGRFNIVTSEGSATRKSVGITGGLTYYFGD